MASGLGLPCLHMFHKKNARLIWNNHFHSDLFSETNLYNKHVIVHLSLRGHTLLLQNVDVFKSLEIVSMFANSADPHE